MCKFWWYCNIKLLRYNNRLWYLKLLENKKTTSRTRLFCTSSNTISILTIYFVLLFPTILIIFKFCLSTMTIFYDVQVCKIIYLYYIQAPCRAAAAARTATAQQQQCSTGERWRHDFSRTRWRRHSRRTRTHKHSTSTQQTCHCEIRRLCAYRIINL